MAYLSRYLHSSGFVYLWRPFLYSHPKLISQFVFKAHFSCYVWGSFLCVHRRLISPNTSEAHFSTYFWGPSFRVLLKLISLHTSKAHFSMCCWSSALYTTFFVSQGGHESYHVYKSLPIFLVYGLGMGQAVTIKLPKWDVANRRNKITFRVNSNGRAV